MAVQNKYTDAKIAAGRLTEAANASGSKPIILTATFPVAAADDDGSIYRLFKAIPSSLVPIRFSIYNDALTAGTVWAVGIYETDLGAVINNALLASALDLSTAHAPGTTPVNGLAALTVAQFGQQMLWEIAGKTILNRPIHYDICLTAGTVGTSAGNVTVIAEFINP